MTIGKVQPLVSKMASNWVLPNADQQHTLEPTALLLNQNELESEVRSYPRRIPIAIKNANGPLVKDERNQIFLDCLAGAGALPLGHNHPEVNEALIDAIGTHTPFQTLDISTPIKDAFMKAVKNALPSEFSHQVKLQFCGPSGADAVEAAIKLAKTATGRHSVISFQGGYHGMTHGALSLTGNLGAKQNIVGLMSDVHFMPYPYRYRCPFGNSENTATQCLHYLKTQLADPESGMTKPAAIIIEAVQGEGGVIPAPLSFLKGLRKLCNEFQIPLIIDEIQSGFGRTGKLFAFEYAGIIPDILVMSKALGGSLPLSLIAFNKHFDAWTPGGHTGTFRGNQLAMVTGRRTLEIIQRDKLADNADRIGKIIRDAFTSLKNRFGQIGDVRGKGLMIGIEIVHPNGEKDALGNPKADGNFAKAVQRAALHRGLICELGGRHGAVIRLLPPLNIDDTHADFIIRVLSDAIAYVNTISHEHAHA